MPAVSDGLQGVPACDLRALPHCFPSTISSSHNTSHIAPTNRARLTALTIRGLIVPSQSPSPSIADALGLDDRPRGPGGARAPPEEGVGSKLVRRLEGVHDTAVAAFSARMGLIESEGSGTGTSGVEWGERARGAVMVLTLRWLLRARRSAGLRLVFSAAARFRLRRAHDASAEHGVCAPLVISCVLTSRVAGPRSPYYLDASNGRRVRAALDHRAPRQSSFVPACFFRTGIGVWTDGRTGWRCGGDIRDPVAPHTPASSPLGRQFLPWAVHASARAGRGYRWPRNSLDDDDL
ncbi:hypothetical protein DFH07DRAFT_957404 [Mycena maculata]|uniref:Uncharacterized protein n=1 Tax=Mycena maculata TaxID=230809 RepID=A0AAD7JE74_9AGAR|nr:hypothetical protein DFH07DRAFT_957404 [Mycena maculata]